MKLKTLLATFLVAAIGLVEAQPVVGTVQQQITNNLITNPTFVGTTGWTTTGAVGGNGPTHPAAPANGNGYTFTYSQGTIAQTYAINQALANVGAGVQIAGFDYGFKYRFGCANSVGGYCENPNGVQDTLNATSTITSSTGQTLYTRYYALGSNATSPYSTTFSNVDTQQRFSAALPVENLGNFKISFTGQDNGYWGGNYGPTIKDVYSKAVYTVDPCVSNPLYSPSCPNYNQVLTSQSIFAQTYAINQALNLSGAGVQINGFEYGYHYYVGGEWCSSTFLGIFCNGWSPSSMAVDVNVTSSTGSSLYTATHNHTEQNAGGQPSYSYVFPQQRLLSSMGNFSLTTREVGSTALYSSWSRWQYTPDPCVVDPLSSQSCPGYAQAFLTQQCTANPLSSQSCPGYAQAMFTQQCSANALSDPSCPGYASAYLTYQCSINPLYSTTCAGYAETYKNQQCSIDPLYDRTCNGYAAAYKTQQCSLNVFYATDCPGYEQAYKTQQCSLNALYALDCPGYAAAYKSQQCSINALYATDCPGYAVAFKNQQCTLSALYASDCPGYAVAFKNQQCSLNALYASDCPGYAAAYKTQQCSLNSLYANDCPGYAVAFKNQQCSLNPLYATDCNGYAAAYKTQQCTANPLFAPDCPGYETAFKNQQCSLSALYAPDCPGYAVAFKNQQCSLNALFATDCPGYDQAYLNSQCIKDSLYSNKCEGYATAYAIKNLIKFSDSTVSSSVNQSLSNTAAVRANDPSNTVVPTTTAATTVSTDGTVSTGVSATGDTNVDKAIAPKPTSASNNSPAAPVQMAPPPAPMAARQDDKKPDDKKPEGGGPGPQQAQNEPKGGDSKPAAPTARQEIQAKREAAAKAAAVESGKNLAGEMGKAADMESQKQIQNVVIQAMGFTPGFDTYSKAIMSDVVGYKPFSIYNNQKNIDSRANQRMFGGTDRLHNEMVDSQYNKGK